MKQLTSFELSHVMEELKDIKEGKVETIYHPSYTEFILRVYGAKTGKFNIRVALPGLFYRASLMPQNPPEPSSFCTHLRKRLKGAKILDMQQMPGERIIFFDLGARGYRYRLIIELFGKGNIILTNHEDLSIISALVYRDWADRSIKRNVPYAPPTGVVAYSTVTYEDFKRTCKEKTGLLVKALALAFGLGGVYAQEVCLRAGIAQDVVIEDLSEEMLKQVHAQIGELRQAPSKPRIIEEDTRIVDVVPIELQVYEKYSSRSIASFNDALDEVLGKKVLEQQAQRQNEPGDKKRRQVEAILRQQNEQLVKLKKNIEEYTKKGEFIYTHYQDIEEFLSQVKEAAQKGKLKEHAKEKPYILSVDQAAKRIEVDVNE